MAINRFLPSAMPTHSTFTDGILLTVKERQFLHRALVRCRGFYEFMTSEVGDSVSIAAERVKELGMSDEPARESGIRQLPVVDFLSFSSEDYTHALLMEVLPEDRDRTRQYLRHRHLGLGLISAVSLARVPFDDSYLTIFSHRDRASERRRYARWSPMPCLLG